MKTKTLPVFVKRVCFLLVLGINCNTSVFGGRILYGQVANPVNYPFVVYLTMRYGEVVDGCGGTVISNHFILTAGHCLEHAKCDEIEIGKSSWQRGDGAAYFGHKCHIYFDYVSGTSENDIGLLETRADLLQDPEITRCDLPIPDTTYAVGTPALIVGWGQTEANIFAKELLHATVHVFDRNECNDRYNILLSCSSDVMCPPEIIPQYSFCTLGDNPRPPGACIGDSGGPVIIDGTVAGIVSSVILRDNVCAIGAPSLHTLVSEYVPWIMMIADLERRGKYSKHRMTAPVAKPLGNYTNRVSIYQ